MTKEEIQALVGSKVAAMRSFRKIPQTELAEKLGISISGIVRKETGRADFLMSEIYQACKVLNMDIRYVTGELTVISEAALENKPPIPPKDLDEKLGRKTVFDIVSVLEELDDNTLIEVLRFGKKEYDKRS